MRRVLSAIFAAGAVSLSVTAVASAGPSQNAKLDIFTNGGYFYYCGGNPGTGADLGFVNFHRLAPDKVSVNYHLKDAEPNATYDVALVDATACPGYQIIGTITTDRNGVGDLDATATVNPASTEFSAWDHLGPSALLDQTQAVTLNP